MGRMQNENLEETSPTRPQPGSGEDQGTRPEDLGQTVPTPVGQMDTLSNDGEIGQTVPTPVGQIDNLPYNDETGLTVPMAAGGAALISPPEPPAKKRHWLRNWSLLGLLALILVAAISAFSGYRAGIHQRTDAEAAQSAQLADEQYNLALSDMQSGQFDRARQRLDYVIRLDPNYPNVTEKMAEVMLLLNATATPTPRPEPTLAPTPGESSPDGTVDVEGLFSQAQQYLSNNDWANAIDTLLALRKADPEYQPVWVDGRLYVAYRNSGVEKILKKADLEGGIYDLTLAERFGLLDADAEGYLTWARLYITGASFWDLDWAQAVYYFGQIAPALPNLTDGSGWTATERYRLALINYGDLLGSQDDWCSAQEQYSIAMTLGSNADLEDKYAKAEEKCGGGGEGGDHHNGNPDATQEPPAAQPTEEPPTPYP
jgi:tetratricopeptide (TPR) repeat protein